MQVTWDSNVFTLLLAAPDSPTDTYVWEGVATPGLLSFAIKDGTAGTGFGLSVLSANTRQFQDSGNLFFTAAQAVPEPSSVALMLAGIGLLLVLMRKRLAPGLESAT
jgi:hypothetical protein